MAFTFSLSYSMRYTIFRPWVVAVGLYWWCKAFIQRGWRGYADSDVWGLDSYLSEWLPSALRRLNKSGCPASLVDSDHPTDEEIKEGSRRFKRILEQMAEGFEAAKQIDDLEWHVRGNKEESDRRRKMMEDKERLGFELFTKWYHNLWD